MNRSAVLVAVVLGISFAANAEQPATEVSPQPSTQPAEPARARLASGDLEIFVTLPEEGFQGGSRFDWSGRVSFIQYKGHTFIGRWRTDAATGQRTPGHHGAGTSDEFNDVQPIQTEPDPANPDKLRFVSGVKIGVGLLERVTEGKRQRVVVAKPGRWTITRGPDSIEFHQDFSDGNCAYSYTKRVTIANDKPSFDVAHLLRNTGDRDIETRSYCHNWMMIDGQGIGPQYRFTFPFELAPVVRDDKPVFKDARGAQIAGRELNFLGESKGGTFYCELTGFKGVKDNQVVVENLRTGAGFRIAGDWELSRYHVYATGGEVCPEPFIQIKLQPGQQQSWTATYSFFTFEPQPTSAPATEPG